MKSSPTSKTTYQEIAALAKASDSIVVLWLYGSRAKGNDSATSDWDLAAAFDPVKLKSPLETRLRPELLALDWQRALGLPEGKISITDINQSPTPLAFSAISSGKVIYCADEGRRMQEEARIMSQMEIDITAGQSKDMERQHGR